MARKPYTLSQEELADLTGEGLEYLQRLLERHDGDIERTATYMARTLRIGSLPRCRALANHGAEKGDA